MSRTYCRSYVIAIGAGLFHFLTQNPFAIYSDGVIPTATC